jgi:hypothetical protein
MGVASSSVGIMYGLFFNRTVACTRFVCLLTGHYFVVSHSSFGRLLLSLVKFIRICMGVASSSVGIIYGLFFDRTIACTRYVWVLTGHYYMECHSSFGRLLRSLVKFIRICMGVASSSVGIIYGLFWMKQRLLHGTFGH